MPPQNTPLWHKNYFKLKAIEEETDTIKPLCHSICLKAGHKYVKIPPTHTHQDVQKIIAWDNSRPLSAQRWHQRNLQIYLNSISFLLYIFIPTVCFLWKTKTALLCPVISLYICCSLLKVLCRPEFQVTTWSYFSFRFLPHGMHCTYQYIVCFSS